MCETSFHVLLFQSLWCPLVESNVATTTSSEFNHITLFFQENTVFNKEDENYVSEE